MTTARSRSSAPSRTILGAVTVGWLFCAVPATAQETIDRAHDAHGHIAVTTDAAFHWDALIDYTVSHYPSYVELLARDAEARAWRRRASGLLAGAPSVSLSYLSDRALEETGLREYEAGIDLPLWRPGTKRLAWGVSDRVDDEAVAARAALRWEVTGYLRAALWDISAAIDRVSLAEDALAAAEDVERVVTRRYEVGELALDDTLLAREAVLARRGELLERQAELVDAERAYMSLTGLSRRPADFAEEQTGRSDYDSAHPLLSLRTLETERARAEVAFMRSNARGGPNLRIGSRRQRDPFTDFYIDSFGIAVSVPFGGQATTATTTAAAARRLAEAESSLDALVRELDTAVHEAEHTINVTKDALLVAEERADTAMRHWQMGQTAFEHGEIVLVDLLRREEAARLASRELERLQTRLGRSIAELNQAIGEFP